MSRFIVASLMFVCLFATVAYSQDNANPSAKVYQPSITYDGIYAPERLYQYSDYQQTWFASSAHKFWGGLNCPSARMELERWGEWVGNLTDRGACAGNIEAPRWATGNFLNYLRSK